jgi:hypothetical protein
MKTINQQTLQDLQNLYNSGQITADQFVQTIQLLSK